MSDFYKDLLNGSGTLSGRTPDTGTALTAPALNLDDGTFVQASGNAALAAMILDGLGAAQWDQSVEAANVGYFKLPTPPGADYFLEVVMLAAPFAQTFRIYLMARASTMVTGAWDADSINFLGIGLAADATFDYVDVHYAEASDGSATNFDSAATYSSPSGSYPAGNHTITFRLEVEGAVWRAVLNGEVVDTGAITDPNFTAAGNAYIGFAFLDAFSADLSTARVLSMRAGTLPDVSGDFWTAFVKTTERAG